jgi:hypothetical protein
LWVNRVAASYARRFLFRLQLQHIVALRTNANEPTTFIAPFAQAQADVLSLELPAGHAEIPLALAAALVPSAGEHSNSICEAGRGGRIVTAHHELLYRRQFLHPAADASGEGGKVERRKT